MKTKFKKGMKVIRYLHGAGLVTQSVGVVLRVYKNKTWLYNGNGNRASLFINGTQKGVYGFWEEIKKV